jgi:hypothetical protein
MTNLTTNRIALDALHRAALLADDAFGAALRRAYGSRAGDMRYRTSDQSVAVQALGAAYVKAIDAWRDAYRLSLSGQITESRARELTAR